ncbi:MAG: hypothetical protein PHR79_05340 [Bacteroidales bacterium]|nr:hypothetical protein [Bacteroidales bacterium]
MESIKVLVSRDLKRDYGMRKVQSGCYTKQALIEFDSLPPRIKSELVDPRKGLHVLEHFFKIEKEVVEFYQDYQFWDGSAIDEEKQAIYVANATVLNAVFKLKEARINDIVAKGHRPKRIWQTLCSDATSLKPILKKKYELEHTLPENYRRFQETAERFDKLGKQYLISGKHLNTNGQKVDDATLKMFESLFATQAYKPNFTEVAAAYDGFLSGYVEVINNVTGELYNPKDFPKLSKGTVYNYLSEWDSKIATYAMRSGDRQKLMGAFKPYHSLDRPKFAGSLISVDDRQPPFEYAKGKRVWFYMAIDVASECYVNWVYGTTKEGIITAFYRQLVRNFAEWNLPMPAELEAESSLNSSFTETFLKEDNMFQFVRIEANNARAKIIERYNEMARYGNEKTREGWIARPFACAEANQAGAKPAVMLPYERIVNECLQEIQDWNNSPHSIYTDKTRWEVFCEMQHPEIKPTNWRGIVPYLGYKTATSCNVGIVKLQGREFLLGDNGNICTGDSLINKMKLVEGEQLDVYWLDGNDARVLKAYAYIGTKCMCELIAKPTYAKARIEQTDDDIKKRELMSSYVATLESYGRNKRKAIDKVTVIDNRPRVLNNKFQVRDLKRSSAVVANTEFDDVEILEEFNDDLMSIETGFKSTSLKDRY